MTIPRPERPAPIAIQSRFSLPEIHWGWLLLIAGVAALIYAVRPVLGPFLGGFVVAYLLDPMVLRLQRWHVPRALASVIVLASALGLLGGLIWAITPIVEAELRQMMVALPALINQWQPLAESWLRQNGVEPTQQSLIANFGERGVSWASTSLGNLLERGLALINVLALAVIAPIVAFYLLRDWAGIKRNIDGWWPQRYGATIRALLTESNEALSGFVRGQFLVCCGLGILYAIAWGLVGLNYAILLGLLAGILGFIPYLGPTVTMLLAMMVALGQFGIDPLRLGIVAAVFFVVQAIEGSFLTPLLIGSRIGLHPVWVLFAILAGGQLAGVVGILVAVPVAAVAGVLTRWAMKRYRASDFYTQPPAV